MAAVLTHSSARAHGSYGIAIKDLMALAKVRLSALVVCTTGVGLWVAPNQLGFARALGVLFASALTVAAANMLNSYMEQDSDALMHRTRNRPLPAKRVRPQLVHAMALILGFSSISVLYAAGSPMCALLAAVAFASYAWMYTPMKRYSPMAVLVGAIPGAIPPMMGYAAATQDVGPMAWALFLLMFVWQLPHFLAIAIYLKKDYARGGLKVLPLVVGNQSTRRWIVATSALLWPTTLLPIWAGHKSHLYFGCAAMTGAMFFALAVSGYRQVHLEAWARKMFVASVFHLSALLLALIATT